MEKKCALLKIDHRDATIYKLGGLQEGEVFTAHPEEGEKGKVHLHKKSVVTWKGQKAPEDFKYFKRIIEELREFDGFVIASHGTAASNEGSNFAKYLEAHHHHDISKKIIASIKTDEHETENQLLARNDHFLNLIHTHVTHKK